MNLPTTLPKRLVSLDALRGLDLFFLFGIGPVTMALLRGPFASGVDSPLGRFVTQQIRHTSWDGFSAWDLIMPLFMFMAGVAIPFSLARYTRRGDGRPTAELFWRIARRVVLLWIFGMIVQGNLLDLKLNGLRLFSNTLQAIAVGYVIAAAVYLSVGRIGQVVAMGALMAIYWSAMTWGRIDDPYGLCGLGNFQPDLNLAEAIDRAVLGRWRDGVSFAADGSCTFSPGYHYVWILSSLTFGVTTLLGVWAGEMLRSSRRMTDWNASKEGSFFGGHGVSAKMAILGIFLIAAGWLWGRVPEGGFGYCPLNKTLWTPSMTLFSGGLSFLLLAAFHEWFDVLRFRFGATFLVIIGMNSILLYVMAHVLPFDQISRDMLYGTEQYLGSWYPAVIRAAEFGLAWGILWILWRQKKFLRV